MKIRILLVMIVLCSTQLLNAQNGWKQYRGPERTAIVDDQLELNADGKIVPKLLWKKSLGPGFSEISIEGDRIYTQFGESIDSTSGLEYLIALEAKTGDLVWKSEVDSLFIEIDKWGDGPRSTPAIDETAVYCLSGRGNLVALNKSNGEILWTINLPEQFGSTIPRWGFSSSPIVIDNKLIIEVGGTENRAVVAFDKTNGTVLWSKGAAPAGYNSPLYTTIDGQKQLIFALTGGMVQSLSADGDTLWQSRLPIRTVVAMPIQVSEKRFFFSNAGRGWFLADLVDGELVEVKRGATMKNDFMTSIYYDGHIYGYHIAALKCLNPETGEAKWQKRGFGKGSLMMVGDKLLIFSDKGLLAIVNATPEGYQEVGRVQALGRTRAWTSPSYDNGMVYLRNLEEIACYQLK